MFHGIELLDIVVDNILIGIITSGMSLLTLYILGEGVIDVLKSIGKVRI